jgi:hypothetical protein
MAQEHTRKYKDVNADDVFENIKSMIEPPTFFGTPMPKSQHLRQYSFNWKKLILIKIMMCKIVFHGTDRLFFNETSIALF